MLAGVFESQNRVLAASLLAKIGSGSGTCCFKPSPQSSILRKISIAKAKSLTTKDTKAGHKGHKEQLGAIFTQRDSVSICGESLLRLLLLGEPHPTCWQVFRCPKSRLPRVITGENRAERVDLLIVCRQCRDRRWAGREQGLATGATSRGAGSAQKKTGPKGPRSGSGDPSQAGDKFSRTGAKPSILECLGK